MELHSLPRVLPMTQPHDGALAIFFCSPGADLQIRRKTFFLDDQGVVASGSHRDRKSLKNTFIVMHDRAGLAVHKVGGAYYVAAEGRANSLMSKAHPEHRHFSHEAAYEIDADAGILRRAGTGRDYDALGLHCFHISNRNLIVTANLNLGPQLSQILHQVVSK